MKLDFNEVDQIFDNTDSKWEGDNAYQGLQILAKYTDDLIHGADHDIMYGPDVEKMIEAGITRKDCKALAKLNWIIDEGEYFACFV